LQKSFEGKINLGTLTKHVIQFFESRKFEEITAVQSNIGYQVIASDSKMYRFRGDLKVDVREEGDVFSVSFELSKKTKRVEFPMTLLTMFGGGYFLLKDLKSDEAWRKIEKEFWSEISSIVTKNRDRDQPAAQHERTQAS